MSEEQVHHRSIRSFVLRQGRVSNAQARYLEAGMPLWGIPYRAEPLDFDMVFGRHAPRILEIGCGMGETTAAIAAAHPENDFLGIEVHTPGVGSLLKEIATRELTNLRVIQHDAVEVVRDMIPRDSLAGIHIYFPDPWPKKRHHKRRLVQGPFVAQLAARLAPGGYLHCATDWEEYAQQMLEVLSAEPLLENTVLAEANVSEANVKRSGRSQNCVLGYAPRPGYRPLTKFEQRGQRLGHGVWDVIFRRRGGHGLD